MQALAALAQAWRAGAHCDLHIAERKFFTAQLALTAELSSPASSFRKQSYAASSTQAKAGELSVALILERLPVVIPEPPAWAVEYHQWLKEIDNSRRVEKPKHWIDTEKDTGDDLIATRQWQPADRVTDADRSNDTKSLSRCLDQRLYFVVKGAGSQFQFPLQQHKDGETMRKAAERVLHDCTEPREAVQTFFLGNGPICHLSRDRQQLFFHKAQLIKGSLIPKAGSGYLEYAWLNKKEILEQTPDSASQEIFEKVL